VGKYTGGVRGGGLFFVPVGGGGGGGEKGANLRNLVFSLFSPGANFVAGGGKKGVFPGAPPVFYPDPGNNRGGGQLIWGGGRGRGGG